MSRGLGDVYKRQKLDCSTSWVENKIIDTVHLLRSDVFPKPSLNCEYCNYLKKRWQLSIT